MNRKHLITAASLMLTTAVAGCSSAGNDRIAHQTSQTVSAHLVRGQTTEAQVRALYGDPMKISFTSGGNQIWEYEFTKMHATASDFIPFENLFRSDARGHRNSLVIYFNKQNIVENYAFSSSSVKVHQGLTP